MKRRGFTLLEILVACGLLLLIGSVIVSLLVPSLRAWLGGQQQSEAQRNAMLVVQRMHEDILLAHPQSIQCSPSQVAFLSSRSASGGVQWDIRGQTLWQRWEIFYLDTTRNQVYLLDSPLAVAIYDPPNLTCPVTAPGPNDRVIAREIYALQCSPLGVTGGMVNVTVGAQDGGYYTRLTMGMQPMVDAP